LDPQIYSAVWYLRMRSYVSSPELPPDIFFFFELAHSRRLFIRTLTLPLVFFDQTSVISPSPPPSPCGCFFDYSCAPNWNISEESIQSFRSPTADKHRRTLPWPCYFLKKMVFALPQSFFLWIQTAVNPTLVVTFCSLFADKQETVF